MIMILPPQSPGEWLAWASAAVTLVFGLIGLLAPRLSLRILRLRPAEGVAEAVGECRARMAGFYLGTAIVAILFNQPFVWMAFGAGWAFTALGRLVSMIFDRGFTAFNGISLAVEVLLAAGPLVYAIGIVP